MTLLTVLTACASPDPYLFEELPAEERSDPDFAVTIERTALFGGVGDDVALASDADALVGMSSGGCEFDAESGTLRNEFSAVGTSWAEDGWEGHGLLLNPERIAVLGLGSLDGRTHLDSEEATWLGAALVDHGLVTLSWEGASCRLTWRDRAGTLVEDPVASAPLPGDYCDTPAALAVDRQTWTVFAGLDQEVRQVTARETTVLEGVFGSRLAWREGVLYTAIPGAMDLQRWTAETGPGLLPTWGVVQDLAAGPDLMIVTRQGEQHSLQLQDPDTGDLLSSVVLSRSTTPDLSYSPEGGTAALAYGDEVRFYRIR